MMAPLSEASKLALNRLRSYKPPSSAWAGLPLSRRAAVLILLFADKFGELRVVLTMRAASLSSYSGQAALPGGKAEEGEGPWECARRESEEEIGLPREKPGKPSRMPKGFWVEELCEMPTNLAKTELVVRPCVAVLHSKMVMKKVVKKEVVGGREKVEEVEEMVEEGGSVEENMLPRLDASEVAAVFSAPFRNFLFAKDMPVSTTSATVSVKSDGKSLNSTPKPPGLWYQGAWTDWHQQRWRMHNFFVPVNDQMVFKPKKTKTEGQEVVKDQLEGLLRYKVWGMTARILVDAARYAYDQEPEFEHNSHFGDEEMIARLRKIGSLGDTRKPGEMLTREQMRKAANL